MSQSRRDAYLALRQAGSTHEDACRTLGIDIFSTAAYRYARWWEKSR